MNIKFVKQNIEDAESLRLITAALGEIATVKIKANRDQILQNINFFKEISQIYHTIKAIAVKSGLQKADKSNGKTISILLSSNYKFYGGLDLELVYYFLESVKKYQTDMLIIGKTGEEILSKSGLAVGITKLLFATDTPSLEEFKKLTEQIRPYRKILFYHPKFVTLLSQEPTVTDISPTTNIEAAKGRNETKGTDVDILDGNYILEPEIGKMMDFFERQILGLLIDSLFLESEIARTAARMISMDQAEVNAEKEIKGFKKQYFKARQGLLNQSILETYSGMRREKREAGS